MSADLPCTLITGASSGIGRAIAVRLSGERRLMLHGRDASRLEETRGLCAGAGHLTWARDLRESQGLGEALAGELQAAAADVDCFIHCAGMVTILPARCLTAAAAAEILQVNTVAALEIVATLLKKRVNHQNLRSVLFVSSVWSRFGSRGYTLYSASKGALDAAMRSLAVELAPGVRVNSIALGAIRTRMAEGGFSDPEIAANLERQYPLGPGRPEDAAEMAAYLVSEKARWITGQQFFVDGGRTANMSLK